jgi:hypothetical protein
MQTTTRVIRLNFSNRPIGTALPNSPIGDKTDLFYVFRLRTTILQINFLSLVPRRPDGRNNFSPPRHARQSLLIFHLTKQYHTTTFNLSYQRYTPHPKIPSFICSSLRELFTFLFFQFVS